LFVVCDLSSGGISDESHKFNMIICGLSLFSVANDCHFLYKFIISVEAE